MNIKTKELIVPKDVILSKASIEILIKVRQSWPARSVYWAHTCC
jgi:hypothetical protein